MRYLIIYRKGIGAESAKEIIGWAEADLILRRSGRTLHEIAGLEAIEDEDGNLHYPEMSEDQAFEAALDYFNEDGKMFRVYDPKKPDQLDDFMAKAVNLAHFNQIESCLYSAGFTITEASNILKDYFEVEEDE